MPSILVTGAAGFIGSAFVREALRQGARVVMLDALTYAGHLANIEECVRPGACDFVRGDIGDTATVLATLRQYQVTSIVNFAAETHVDNSILGPAPFIETNILGTFRLLEAARAYLAELEPPARADFRFVHVSTDEVFGELGETGHFTEDSPYRPNSPYSASKAASDHLVRAWGHTYGLPIVITNCSNNYGPRQLPEKLIPRMIVCALNGDALPVYGKGENVRDWIHVEDHARGVWLALTKGTVGESYCFGGRSERRNLDVVQAICKQLDQVRPAAHAYATQITFVEDRAGHDWRYAIDDHKAKDRLGFQRQFSNFEAGLEQTVNWYVHNEVWLRTVKEKRS